MTPDVTEDDMLRAEALDAQARHDPDQQGADRWPGRCALCHFTRHPCEVYDLATEVLALLDRLAPAAPPREAPAV